MAYDLEKMNSVKSLERILSVSDDLIDESNLMGLSSVIAIPNDRALDNVSAKHYETIIHILIEAGTLRDKKDIFFNRETDEETGFEYNVYNEYSITINLDELNKFRDRLIRRINELKKEKPSSNSSNNRLEFDPVKAVLHINSSEIDIKKSKYQTHLLKTIFQNREELLGEWYFADIGEAYDHTEDEATSNERYRNAIYQLNKKIALETQIRDFFVIKSNSFQLNKVYLKSS